jgi:membrane protein DedA with SNARE-associated domain
VIAGALEWLIGHPPGGWVHGALAGTAFVETLFPPFPGDVLFIALSGWLGGGMSSLALSAASGFAGCLAATAILVSVGRALGRGRARPLVSRLFGEGRTVRAEDLFRRRGGPVLLASRFIPGLRSLLVFVAGYSGMRPVRAMAWAGGSAVAWYSILSVAGYLLGCNLQGAEALVRRYESLFVICAAALLLAFLVVRLSRRRVRS